MAGRAAVRLEPEIIAGPGIGAEIDEVQRLSGRPVGAERPGLARKHDRASGVAKPPGDRPGAFAHQHRALRSAGEEADLVEPYRRHGRGIRIGCER
jgi:hypothetical protein